LRIKVSLSIGEEWTQDVIEVSDNGLEGLNEHERHMLCTQALQDWASNYIEMSYEVVEEE
jgi:hypothetical protein